MRKNGKYGRSAVFLAKLRLVVFWGAASFVLGAQERAPEGGQDSVPGVFNEADILLELNTPQGPSPAEEIPASASLGGVGLYLRVIGVSLFLIIVIVFVLRMLRRLSLRRPPERGRLVRILESQPLHADRILHLVETGGEIFLLGSSSGGINVLQRFEEQGVKDELLLRASAQTGRGQSFRELLGDWLGSPKGEAGPEEKTGPERSFFQRQRERLEKLFGEGS